MRTRLATTALALAALLPLTACGGDSDASTSTLRITGIPDGKITTLEAQGGALSDYLGQQLGIDFRYDKANDYTAAVNNLAANKSDIAWLGGVTAVDAEDRTNGEVEIVVCRAIDLKFKSYFIANKDVLESGKVKKIGSLEELKPMLKDLAFRFGSKKSTSGHIMPRHFMVQAGIDPEEDIKGGPSNSMVSGHDETFNAVATGLVDVGVLNYTNYDAKSDADKANAPIIFVSPEYVDYCLVVHKRVGQKTIDEIRRAFLELDRQNPEHKPLLDAFSAEKFISADPKNWDSIRQVVADLKKRGMLQ